MVKVSLQKLQWILCFSGFLDLFGVSMIFPILVHRSKDLGATPSQVGLFGSIYGLLQFFTSPIMGQISDHVGRRRVLLISLVGTAIGYFFLGLANSIMFLAIARIPSGIFKHSQSMSRTFLADVTPQKETASIFGSFNSMSSLGFIVGPAIGGILASYENGFFLVAVLSSSIFLMNALLVYNFVSPANEIVGSEKTDSKKDKEPFKLDLFSSLKAFQNMSSIPWKKIWEPFTVKFLFAISIILFRSNFSSILAYRFEVDTKTNGFIMSFNGIISAMGSALVRWISPHFNTNDSLHNTFSIILVLSLAIITAAPTLSVVIAGIVPLCLASSVLRVTNSIAIYQKGDGQAKGFLIGLSDTLTSLSRALGPAIAGFAQEMSLYGPGSCAVLFGVFATSIGLIDFNRKLHTE